MVGGRNAKCDTSESLIKIRLWPPVDPSYTPWPFSPGIEKHDKKDAEHYHKEAAKDRTAGDGHSSAMTKIRTSRAGKWRKFTHFEWEALADPLPTLPLECAEGLGVGVAAVAPEDEDELIEEGVSSTAA
jgi:hypothetical protein